MKAPGKLILSGEHAVVYGGPAIATSVNRFADCNAVFTDEDCIRIQADLFCDPICCHLEDTRGICEILSTRYQAFCDDELAIHEVLDNHGDLLLFAAVSALGHMISRRGLSITVETDIPVGCGMGSSGAVAASIINTVGHLAEQYVSAVDLYNKTMACENLQHGYPSGIDAYISVYGGCVVYRKNGELDMLRLGKRKLLLVNTGVPITSTGECVSKVRKEFEHSSIWKEFEEVVGVVRQALRDDDSEKLIQAIRANHRLLTSIGVVPERVQTFIQNIEALGGAAKICGAGAVDGEGGGMVWVQGDDQAALTECAGEFGYDVMHVMTQ